MKKLILCLMLLSFATLNYAQSISANTPTFNIGEPMTFTYSGGPGNATDWIGVYPVDTIPDGTPPASTWDYITSPAGQFTLNGQNQGSALVARVYAVHLFCCDGYGILASDTFALVGEAPASIAAKSFAIFHKKLTFEYSGGTGSPVDWIGVYRKGQTPGTDPSSLFLYVPNKKGEIEFDLDTLSPGEYDAHFFCCDVYDKLASTTFTIYPSTAPNLQPTGPITQNTPFTFNFGGGTGSFVDWVGIYPAGEVPDGTPSATAYVYVSAPNGSVDFGAVPELIPGTNYDAHLFCCDVYDILASYKNFTVSPNATIDAVKNKKYFTAKSTNNGIDITFIEAVKGNLSLYNMMGQIIRNVVIDGESNVVFSQVNIGAYVIRLQGNENSQTMKFIVK